MTSPRILVIILCCSFYAQQFKTCASEVDRQRAATMGLREISSKHLRLWTDVPTSGAIEELPRVFDAAVPIWAEYFGISPEKISDWRVQGYLIQDRAKFTALNLLPENNPDFINGYATAGEFWLEEQPSDYYRRHLLLHEGTHSFMLSQLGAAGPGWYMEGMAELLGTHRWQDGQLELRVMPASKEDVPMWGRIKVIREAVAAGKPLTLNQVLAISNREALSVDAYSWCWALAKFLDSHPRYGDLFRTFARHVNEPSFTKQFRSEFADEWGDLEFEWRAFVAALDYGYDTTRMVMDASTKQPLAIKATATVAADRGWQALPWKLEAGMTYKVTAKGRYQIAHDGEPWPCEPGGVTLRYHEGRPLGMLLGMVRTASEDKARGQVFPIGLGTDFTVDDDAVLYVRVNDSPAELSDNQGSLEVRLEPVSRGN